MQMDHTNKSINQSIIILTVQSSYKGLIHTAEVNT